MCGECQQRHILFVSCSYGPFGWHDGVVSANDYPETPADHTDLIAFGARHSVVVNDLQESFSEWLGADAQMNWSVDLLTGKLTLGTRQLSMQLWGSHAYESDTWLWAWANESYTGAEFDQVTGAAKWLRDASPDHERAWELTTGKFSMGKEMAEGGVAGWPLQFACFAWLRPKAVYSGDYGSGRFFCSIHDEKVPDFAPDAVRFPRLLTNAISTVPMVPHLDLVTTYARWFGLELTNQAQTWTLRFPEMVYEITFDEYQRVTGLQGHSA